MRIIFAGSKTISCQCLEWLVESGHTVVGVFGHKTESEHDRSLRVTAEKLGLPFYDTNINKAVELANDLKPDYVLSVQYAPILKKAILDVPTDGCWNLHCGELPRYGGCKVVLQAIWNGSPVVGITFHRMDEGIDTGYPICMSYLPIDDRTAKELYPHLNKQSLLTFKYGIARLGKDEPPEPMTSPRPKLYYRMSALDIGKQRVMRWDETMEECRRRYAAFTLIDGSTPLTDSGEKVVNLRKEPDVPVSVVQFGDRFRFKDGRHYIAVRDGSISCELIKCE